MQFSLLFRNKGPHFENSNKTQLQIQAQNYFVFPKPTYQKTFFSTSYLQTFSDYKKTEKCNTSQFPLHILAINYNQARVELASHFQVPVFVLNPAFYVIVVKENCVEKKH